MEPRKRAHGEKAEVAQDADMTEVKGRKIIKAKRRVKDEPIVDEEGNELSFEDDSDEWEDEDAIDQ